MIPQEALEYIRRKRLRPAFSYQDVWNSEHATAFTVAKAMQIDVLSDIKSAVESAIENGETFETFRRNLEPTLVEKRWWGRRQMRDPLTGETRPVQLGSAGRLRTIYRTNLRSASAHGRWERGQASTAHTHILYLNGPSVHHREQHQAWHGLLLPKDDPFWNTHFPPNGWGCKCYARFVTRREAERLMREGIIIPVRADGTGGGTIAVKTTRPEIRYRTYRNRRSGIVERVPEGIDPGFGWNSGQGSRDVTLFSEMMSKARDRFPRQMRTLVRAVLRNEIREPAYRQFIKDAMSNPDRVGRHITPVGFVNEDVSEWLWKNQNIVLGPRSVIALEDRIVAGRKARRHAAAADALSEDQWLGLIDTLDEAEVFAESGNRNLIYLADEIKIVVSPTESTVSRRGAAIDVPRVVSAYRASGDEIQRIRGLERIR